MPNGWSVYADFWLNGWGLSAIAETVVNVSTSSQSYDEAVAQPVDTTATSTHSNVETASQFVDTSSTSSQFQDEAVSESVVTSATSTDTMDESILVIDAQTNIASSTQIFTEAEFDLLDSARAPPTTAQHTIDEQSVTRDALDNSSTALQFVDEAFAFAESPIQSIGNSTPSLVDATSETVYSSTSNFVDVSSADADTEITSSASTQTIDETLAFAESLTSSSTSTQIAADAFGTYETVDSSQTSTQEAISSDVDSAINIVTSDQSISEESITSDTLDVSQTSSQSILEALLLSEAPMQSVTTGEQTIVELVAITETVTNEATDSAIISEAFSVAEDFASDQTSEQTIDETFVVAEQPMQSVGTSSLSIDEQITTVVFEDVLTNEGTITFGELTDSIAEIVRHVADCPEYIRHESVHVPFMTETIVGDQPPPEPVPDFPAPGGDVSVYQGGALFPLQNVLDYQEELFTEAISAFSLMEEVERIVVVERVEYRDVSQPVQAVDQPEFSEEVKEESVVVSEVPRTIIEVNEVEVPVEKPINMALSEEEFVLALAQRSFKRRRG